MPYLLPVKASQKKKKLTSIFGWNTVHIFFSALTEFTIIIYKFMYDCWISSPLHSSQSHHTFVLLLKYIGLSIFSHWPISTSFWKQLLLLPEMHTYVLWKLFQIQNTKSIFKRSKEKSMNVLLLFTTILVKNFKDPCYPGHLDSHRNETFRFPHTVILTYSVHY